MPAGIKSFLLVLIPAHAFIGFLSLFSFCITSDPSLNPGSFSLSFNVGSPGLCLLCFITASLLSPGLRQPLSLYVLEALSPVFANSQPISGDP